MTGYKLKQSRPLTCDLPKLVLAVVFYHSNGCPKTGRMNTYPSFPSIYSILSQHVSCCAQAHAMDAVRSPTVCPWQSPVSRTKQTSFLCLVPNMVTWRMWLWRHKRVWGRGIWGASPFTPVSGNKSGNLTKKGIWDQNLWSKQVLYVSSQMKETARGKQGTLLPSVGENQSVPWTCLKVCVRSFFFSKFYSWGILM